MLKLKKFHPADKRSFEEMREEISDNTEKKAHNFIKSHRVHFPIKRL